MATLDADEVRRVAALAHLALTPDEVELFSRQLGDILDYVRQVQAQDTAGVAPMSHASANGDGERPDEPTPGLDRAAALAGAPEAALEAGLFKVPRVVG
jgi:aspartyl-tRNA(Asn)/glutamyl-tRNA(Gln) amidotransferase subunit C